MRQITVVTEAPSGSLARISSLLGGRGINIESLSAEATDDHGVVILTVDRYDEALSALRDAGFHAISEDAIVIRLRDEPGALAKISQRFADAGIELRSVRILRRANGFGLVAVSTERTSDALELVRDELVS